MNSTQIGRLLYAASRGPHEERAAAVQQLKDLRTAERATLTDEERAAIDALKAT